MPKEDSTLIAIVLDRSGSMMSVREEVIGGFNKLIEDNKKEPGECLVTLAQFDDDYELIYNAIPLGDVAPLTEETYVPRAMTRLYDALGKTIDEVGIRLAAMEDDKRPSRVLMIVLTDGAENSSREYTGDRVREMIEHQRTKYQWEFAFHGCDERALQQAVALGYAVQNVKRNAGGKKGTTSALADMSIGSRSYRGGRGYSQN
jgi:uncharacterized protein YegL